MAIIWPTPGFKGRTLELWVFNRWVLISASAVPHCVIRRSEMLFIGEYLTLTLCDKDSSFRLPRQIVSITTPFLWIRTTVSVENYHWSILTTKQQHGDTQNRFHFCCCCWWRVYVSSLDNSSDKAQNRTDWWPASFMHVFIYIPWSVSR